MQIFKTASLLVYLYTMLCFSFTCTTFYVTPIQMQLQRQNKKSHFLNILINLIAFTGQASVQNQLRNITNVNVAKNSDNIMRQSLTILILNCFRFVNNSINWRFTKNKLLKVSTMSYVLLNTSLYII